MKISITGKLSNLEPKMRFGLDAIFREIERAVNGHEAEIMPLATPSAVLTGDTLVKTGRAIYRGFTVTVSTATAAINVYDGTDNTGKLIDVIPASTTAGTTEERSVGIICETGIYVDYTGSATGSVVIAYESL